MGRSRGGAKCPLDSARAPPALSLPGPSAACPTSQVKAGDPVGRAHLGATQDLCGLLCSRPVSPSLRLCCPLAGQGGCAQEAPWGSWFTLILPQSFLPVLAGPYGALQLQPTLHPPPSSRKPKGYSWPRPSSEPSGSTVFLGPLGPGPSLGLGGSTLPCGPRLLPTAQPGTPEPCCSPQGV